MNLNRILIIALCVLPLLSASAKPNVIVIVTDDQGYGDMACHGNPWLETPNLDRMHRESVRLDDYHVDPVCTPTRAALLTGRHALRVGAWTVTEGQQLLSANEATMADVFSASGYRTGMFGKWHLGDTFPYAPRFRGFDEVLCHKAGGIDEVGNPKGNDFFDDTLFRNGVPEPSRGYCTDVFFDAAIRFVEKNRETPFFVYLPLNAMHGPFRVLERYSRRFEEMGHPEIRSKFYGMIENFDENLGRLFGVLDREGIDEDTIVIFMGDNGTAAGITSEFDSSGFNAGMRGKKGSVYEGGHRVACFVRWPETLQAGMTVDRLTSHHDWLPTLIDLAELNWESEKEFDGVSISPLLFGDREGFPERRIFVHRQGKEPEPWESEDTGRFPQFAVLTEDWRLANGELYDIKSDPTQKSDLSSSWPAVVRELTESYYRNLSGILENRAGETAFFIGAEEEPETEFTVRDWSPLEGRAIWKKEQLGDDEIFSNGSWRIDVRRPGEYRIELRRFPLDEAAAMGANAARIRIGENEKHSRLDPRDEKATFEWELAQGPSILQAWLTDANTGQDRGAYFVRVKFLGALAERGRDK